MSIEAMKKAQPLISTEHGPWIPSTHPGEEGESYCRRCLLRDKFLGSRQCDPHIVAPPPRQPEPLTDEEITAWISQATPEKLNAMLDFARAIDAANGTKENMKISATVTKTTNVNFELNPKENFSELLREFNESIFETDESGLINFICSQLTDDPYFIQGVGPVQYSSSFDWEHTDENVVLLYNTSIDNCEVHHE